MILNFLAAWILTPLVLLLVSLALGSLIKKGSEEPKHPIHILATGFALLILIGTVLTNFVVTAKFATLIIVLLSIFSIFKNLIFIKNMAKEWFSFAVVKVSYLLAGLPILSTFKVSWPGWVQLDDTATFLALTDHIMKAGHSVPDKVVSTFDRTLQVILGGSFYGTYNSETNTAAFSYPVGSLIPLGVTGQISRVDLAWLYFPFLAFGVAITAGLLFLITRQFISNRWLAALVSITIAHASTFYAYALWGGIKEVVLVPILIYSLVVYQRIDKANILQITLISAAIFAVAGKSGIGFIAAELLLFILLKLLINKSYLNSKKIFFSLGALVFIVVALSGVISDLFNKYLIPEIPDSGNLARPVNMLQIFGVWPSGDFRGDIYWQPFSYIGLAVIALLTSYGFWKALRSEYKFIAIGVITTLAITIYSSIFSGIWLTGKAIAVASPFFLLATFFGIANLMAKQRLRIVANIFLIFTMLGVATSNYLAYRHTWIAPSEKIAELQSIGKKFKGEGPALMTEYSVAGARYFLRDLQAQSASELRVDAIPMRDGKVLEKGFAADIDLFDNEVIEPFKLLVLKHTASGSRPLFNYDLAYEGKYYDVWKRNSSVKQKIISVPLGNNYVSGSEVSCQEIENLTSDVRDKIYAAERKLNFVSSLAEGQLEPNWAFDKGNLGAVEPIKGGYLQGIVEVDKTADYQWFIAGSYPGKLEIYLDQEKVFTGHTFFEGNKFLSNYIFTSKVTAGKHLLEIRYSKPLLKVGAGVIAPMGPIYLSSETAAKSRIISTSKNEIKKLCNRNLDWLAWVAK